jgi:hypothetical protein
MYLHLMQFSVTTKVISNTPREQKELDLHRRQPPHMRDDPPNTLLVYIRIRRHGREDHVARRHANASAILTGDRANKSGALVFEAILLTADARLS